MLYRRLRGRLDCADSEENGDESRTWLEKPEAHVHAKQWVKKNENEDSEYVKLAAEVAVAKPVSFAAVPNSVKAARAAAIIITTATTPYVSYVVREFV